MPKVAAYVPPEVKRSIEREASRVGSEAEVIRRALKLYFDRAGEGAPSPSDAGTVSGTVDALLERVAELERKVRRATYLALEAAYHDDSEPRIHCSECGEFAEIEWQRGDQPRCSKCGKAMLERDVKPEGEEDAEAAGEKELVIAFDR